MAGKLFENFYEIAVKFYIMLDETTESLQ